MTVPAFTIEFRASEHPNAPTLTINGSNAAELQDRVDTAIANSLFALAGKAQEQMTASYTLGNVLGARPVDAPKTTTAPADDAAAAALNARKAAAAEAPATPAAAPWGAATHEHRTEWPETQTAAAAPAPVASSGTSWPPKPAWGA